MYIYKRMNQFEFADLFDTAHSRGSFSPMALSALFDFYDDQAREQGEPIEIDPVEIRGQWSEMEVADIIEQYFDGEFDWDNDSWRDEIDRLGQSRVILEVPQYTRRTYLVME